MKNEKEYIPTEEEYNAWLHRYRELAEKTIDHRIERTHDIFKFYLKVLGVISVGSIIVTTAFCIGQDVWDWQAPVAVISIVSGPSIPSICVGKKYYKLKKYREKNIREYEQQLNECALVPAKWQNWGRVR